MVGILYSFLKNPSPLCWKGTKASFRGISSQDMMTESHPSGEILTRILLGFHMVWICIKHGKQAVKETGASLWRPWLENQIL